MAIQEDPVDRVNGLKVHLDIISNGKVSRSNVLLRRRKERVTVDKKTVVSYGRFKSSMDLLLKEEGICVQVKLDNLESPASIRE